MAEVIPARYIKLRNDPNTRHHVPTRFLTPQQQKQRAFNTQRAKDDANPLYNPMAQLSGHALKDVVNQMVEADTAPGIKADQDQLSFLKRYAAGTSANIGTAYGQISNAMPAAIAGQQTASKNLIDTLANQGAQTDTAMQHSIDTAGAATSAMAGVGLDGGTTQRLAAEFARQKQDAIASQDAATKLGAVQNAGFEGIINAAAATLPAQQAQAIGAAVAPISKDIADTSSDLAGKQADKGPLATKYLTQLRQSAFENNAATQTLKLKTADQAGINPITGQPLPTKPGPGDTPSGAAGPFSGLSPNQVAALPQAERFRRIKQYYNATHPAKKDSQHRYTDGPFIGKTPDQVDKLWQTDPKGAQKIADDYMDRIHPPKGSKANKDTPWRTPNEQATANKAGTSLLSNLKTNKQIQIGIKKNNDTGKNEPVYKNVKDMSRKELGTYLAHGGHAEPAIISAVLDAYGNNEKAYYKPHLSKYTSDRLKAARLSRKSVADALGIMTYEEYKKWANSQPKRPATFLDKLP